MCDTVHSVPVRPQPAVGAWASDPHVGDFMSVPASTLLYGRGSTLLNTRALILKTMNGEVYTATDRQTTESHLHSLKGGLLVPA